MGSFTIKYNGTNIATGSGSYAGTNITYNGTNISTVINGTRTLNTNGKLMSGNITMCGKTLATSGKVMSGDVQCIFSTQPRYVAVAGGTIAVSSVAAYSNNGTSWTKTTLPASAQWRDVCYGNGKFVAVSSWDNAGYSGASQTAAYSADGITWTKSTLPQYRNWTSVTYGNGKFVAISNPSGSETTTYAAYSTDGVNWTLSSAISVARGTLLGRIVFGNGKFVCPEMGDYYVLVSTNGAAFTQYNCNARYAYNIAYDSAFGFLIVGAGSGSSSNPYYAVKSTDGTTWTQMQRVSHNGTVSMGGGYAVLATGGGNLYYADYNSIPTRTTWTAKSYSGADMANPFYVGGRFFVTGSGSKPKYSGTAPTNLAAITLPATENTNVYYSGFAYGEL